MSYLAGGGGLGRLFFPQLHMALSLALAFGREQFVPRNHAR